MSKKTKKNTYRNNNNNKITKYRGGSIAEGLYETGKIPLKVAEGVARGTTGVVKGVLDETGVSGVGKYAVNKLGEAGKKVSEGLDSASDSIQKGSISAAKDIESDKKSLGEGLSKAADFAGEYAPTTLLENELKRSGKFIADKASIATDEISDKTKKALTSLEKVTKNVGIDSGSIGNFMVDDENCKFDIPSATKKTQIESKTENDVSNKLSKSELFGDDTKFKKFMTERILQKCREYHDLTKNSPDKYFMRFFNHCSNLIACFNDVTELVYLFNDSIAGDLSFLTDIKNEKSERDRKKEVDLKVEEKKKELDSFTKQQEERQEEEKKIGESEEETKQRLAKEGKKKGEMEKYIKAKEAKMDEIEANKINLKKQIKNLIVLVKKLKEDSKLEQDKIDELSKKHPKARILLEIEAIHAEAIEEVMESNKGTFQSLNRSLQKQKAKLDNELNKKLNDKILPDIKSRIEKRLDDIYSEYQKALEDRENKKEGAKINFLKYKNEETKLNKFLIKYSYAQAEEDKLRKKNEKLDKFLEFLKTNLINEDNYIKPVTDSKNTLSKAIRDLQQSENELTENEDKKENDKISEKEEAIKKEEATIEKLRERIYPYIKPVKENKNAGSFIFNKDFEELQSDSVKSTGDDKKELAPKINDLQKEIKEAKKKLKNKKEDLKKNEKDKKDEKVKEELEQDIKELENEIKEKSDELKNLSADYIEVDSKEDVVGTDSKINILVFFLNNVFIANVKEYAILNSSSDFKFKDDLSRELSKILEYNKYKEQIEKLDRDKEFKQNVAKIGDTNFIDNKMFETIKIEKRDKVEAPAFDMNDLHKKLKNDKDVKKNIYDYYKMLMQLEIDIDSGKVKMDDKFEEEKFGPNMYMYIVLGFLGTALGFELANLSNVRAAMGN